MSDNDYGFEDGDARDYYQDYLPMLFKLTNIIKFIRNNGANDFMPPFGRTPVIHAISELSDGTFEHFIEEFKDSIDFGKLDKNLFLPLNEAIINGSVRKVRAILSTGSVDIYRVDGRGRNALDAARNFRTRDSSNAIECMIEEYKKTKNIQ